MEPVAVQAPYRAAWIRVFRQFSFATGLRYAVVAALVASAFGFVPRAPLRFAALAMAAVSLITQIMIRCPRCHARWPLSSDDDGRRKPCKQCGLRWGQEEEDPPALEPMDPNAF
jgi:hypothetical protein